MFERCFVADRDIVVYILYSVPLVVVDSFKYMEVCVSSYYKWDMHIDKLTTPAHQ